MLCSVVRRVPNGRHPDMREFKRALSTGKRLGSDISVAAKFQQRLPAQSQSPWRLPESMGWGRERGKEESGFRHVHVGRGGDFGDSGRSGRWRLLVTFEVLL